MKKPTSKRNTKRETKKAEMMERPETKKIAPVQDVVAAELPKSLQMPAKDPNDFSDVLNPKDKAVLNLIKTFPNAFCRIQANDLKEAIQVSSNFSILLFAFLDYSNNHAYISTIQITAHSTGTRANVISRHEIDKQILKDIQMNLAMMLPPTLTKSPKLQNLIINKDSFSLKSLSTAMGNITLYAGLRFPKFVFDMVKINPIIEQNELVKMMKDVFKKSGVSSKGIYPRTHTVHKD